MPALFLSLLLTSPPWIDAAAAQPRTIRRARFLMGTVCQITAARPNSDNGITEAFEEIARLDRIMSLFKPDSELSELNRTAAARPFRCSEDLWSVLLRSAEINRQSSGAFDPTAGSEHPGFDSVRMDARARTVSFARQGVRIDLGGIGKGYALDKAADVLRRRGIRSASLNFGGQILNVGGAWSPDAASVEITGSGLRARVADASIATSSQEEHAGHILDPRTNQPVRRAGRVTVILKDATSADAWSTALFVRGIEVPPPEFSGCAVATENNREPVTAGDCAPYLRGGK